MNTLAADTKRAVRGWIPADLSRAQKVSTAAVGIIIVSLVLRTWVVAESWFFEDDFHFLADIARGEDDLAWYFRPHNVHFMPLSFVLVKLVTLGGPFAWWLAAVQTVLLQAAASLSCWWMLRKIFGDRPAILVPLTFYVFSIFSVPSLTWYAAMINQIPLHTCIFLGVLAHVTYLRTRRFRWALLAAAITVVGLMFYVKAILLPMVFGLLALLYFATGRPVPRFLSVVRRYLWGWIAYTAVGVGYLVMYALHMHAESSASETKYLKLAQSMLFDTLGTGLTGLSWSWDLLSGGPRSVTDPSSFLVAISWMFVVAAGFWLFAVRRRALLGLVIAVPYLLAGYAIIAVGRSGSFGALSGNEARYLSDASAILALTLALAIMPLRGAVSCSERREVPLVTFHPPTAIGAIAVVVYVGGSVWSTITYADPWHNDNRTKDYGLTAIDSITAADKPSLADRTVPDDVMWNVNAPYNRISYFFAPIADRFSTPTTVNGLNMLDDDGEVRLATVAGGTTSVPGPLAGCGHKIGDTPTVVDLQSQTFDFPFWMSIGYFADDSGTMTVAFADQSVDAPVRQGLNTLFVRTDGVFDTVELTAHDDVTVCVDPIRVGTLEAVR